MRLYEILKTTVGAPVEEGKDEATRVEEGDHGEQFWIQEP